MAPRKAAPDSPLTPIERRSLATTVFERLRDHVLELEPGDALPSERVLCEQLRVNRGAVREGLKRLEQAGLVTIQQGGPTRVLDYRQTAGLEVLASLAVRGGVIDTAIARSVLEMRMSIGSQAAALCAQRACEQTVAELHAAAEAMAAARGDLSRLQRLALDFWTVVIRGADSVAFQLAFNSLVETYEKVQEYFTQLLEDELTAVERYRELAAQVERGDSEGAAEVARDILQRGTAALEPVLRALDAAQAPGRST